MRYCVSCARPGLPDRPLTRLPLAMSPDLGLCDVCGDKFKRRGVQSGIQRESDRILSTDKGAFQSLMPKPKCGHCGAVVLLDNKGKQPLWCRACEHERVQIVKEGGEPC